MNTESKKLHKVAIAYFWALFILTIFVLVNSFGLFLLVSAIIILPLIIFHFIIGLRIFNSDIKLPFVYYSATNFLIFSLIRIDGVHITTHNGLSALLELVGIRGGFNSEYENVYLFVCLLLFIVQLIIDLYLYKKCKLNKLT